MTPVAILTSSNVPGAPAGVKSASRSGCPGRRVSPPEALFSRYAVAPMARPRKRRNEDAAARVRHLIALDSANVMARLDERIVEMVTLFSRLRDRGPLLTVIDSVYPTATFRELALLSTLEQRAVNEFYELLADLRWYMQDTEDMPLQLQGRVIKLVDELRANHRLLTAVIGPPDPDVPAVVNAEVLARAERRAAGLAPRKRRRG